jgi:exodeoxyribonuclease VII large subunit
VPAQVLSVGLLTSYVRELLEQDDLLADLWVEGEVSGLFQSRAGHVYFTLKDSDSQLRAVLFQGLARRQRYAMRPGDQVAAHGRVTVYEKDGQYQLYADLVQPAGIGLLAMQLELLRQRLEGEGLFDPARKRPIPVAPRCIGVVTSPEGAVWHDIQRVLRRRYPFVEVLLAPAFVQGDRAPTTIVAALDALQADGRAEVIIVARGGGSTEDLWCFNDGRVVRASFSCRVPVVSGVGHETDWTLADEVADVRAPTPSVAAELCTPSVADAVARIEELRERLAVQGLALVSERRREVATLRRTVERASPRPRIIAWRDATAHHRRALSTGAATTLVASRGLVRDRASRLESARQRDHERRRAGLGLAAAKLRMLDPGAVLARGYALLETMESGRPILSAVAVAPRQLLRARLHDGGVLLRAEEPARLVTGEERRG